MPSLNRRCIYSEKSQLTEFDDNEQKLQDSTIKLINLDVIVYALLTALLATMCIFLIHCSYLLVSKSSAHNQQLSSVRAETARIISRYKSGKYTTSACGRNCLSKARFFLWETNQLSLSKHSHTL